MHRIHSIFLALCVLTVFSSGLRGQVEMSAPVEVNGPLFHLDVVGNMEADSSAQSQINLYIEILYDDLQFVKLGEGFEASYEVSAVILDDDDDQVGGSIWKNTVYVQEYDGTNSREDYSLTYRSFPVEPGTYKLSIGVQDLETNRMTKQEAKVKIRDFAGKDLSVSDILFVSDLSVDPEGDRHVKPQVTNRTKGLRSPTFAYFEIYHQDQAGEAEVKVDIQGERTKTRLKKEYDITLSGTTTSQAIAVPVDSLNHDKYKIKIEVKADRKKSKVERHFYVHWDGLPRTAEDLETAIEQTKYIASRDEWKKLSKSPDEKKLAVFETFWKRRDPTPGTEVNEALESYYNRIEYANTNFSVMQRDGWRTDMGMVYILLGAPDDIYRNAYPIDQYPYQRWHYYRINRSFLFYDYTGFGDYRLSSPYSIYELQRYLRN